MFLPFDFYQSVGCTPYCMKDLHILHITIIIFSSLLVLYEFISSIGSSGSESRGSNRETHAIVNNISGKQ